MWKKNIILLTKFKDIIKHILWTSPHFRNRIVSIIRMHFIMSKHLVHRTFVIIEMMDGFQNALIIINFRMRSRRLRNSQWIYNETDLGRVRFDQNIESKVICELSRAIVIEPISLTSKVLELLIYWLEYHRSHGR